MQSTIRTATENDFGDILTLIKEFAQFQKTPERVTNTLELMKEEQDSFNCLVAEVDGKIIGFATFFFCYYSWSGKSMYLDDLYVTDSHRGGHIGTDLLLQIIEKAKAEKCKKVRWQVSNWNQKAIDFYKNFGADVGDIEINCDLELV